MTDDIQVLGHIPRRVAQKAATSLTRHPCPVERHFRDQGMASIHKRCSTGFKYSFHIKEHLTRFHKCTCPLVDQERMCSDRRHVPDKMLDELYKMPRRRRAETQGDHWKRIYEILYPHDTAPAAHLVTTDLLLESLDAPNNNFADVLDAKLQEVEATHAGRRPRSWELFKLQFLACCELLSQRGPEACLPATYSEAAVCQVEANLWPLLLEEEPRGENTQDEKGVDILDQYLNY